MQASDNASAMDFYFYKKSNSVGVAHAVSELPDRAEVVAIFTSKLQLVTSWDLTLRQVNQIQRVILEYANSLSKQQPWAIGNALGFAARFNSKSDELVAELTEGE